MKRVLAAMAIAGGALLVLAQNRMNYPLVSQDNGTGIARYAGQPLPPGLAAGLGDILTEARRAQAVFAAGDDAGVAAPVEAGLTSLHALRGHLGGLGLSDAGRFEIDFRLKLKERDFEDAVLAAHNLTLDALADDGRHANEIARLLQRPAGEIELILALRPK